MKNLVQQEGTMITVTAPVGGTVSGTGVLIGSLFGVAALTSAAGASTEIATRGVFRLAKVSALAIDVGDRVFWVPGTSNVNKTAGGQFCIGVAVSTAPNPSSTVDVRLGAVLPAGT